MNDKAQTQPRAVSELVIEAIVDRQLPNGSETDHRVLTETLRELVKLAKLEKLVDIKLDMMNAMGLGDAGEAIVQKAMAKTVESFKLRIGAPQSPMRDAAPE